MTYERYIEIHNQYDAQLNFWSDKLNSFPKLSDGRVTDEAKQSDDYKNAKRMYDTYFTAFRKLNKDSKEYVKRYGLERREQMLKFGAWLELVNKEQQFYPLFKGKKLNVSELKCKFQQGKTPIEALNDLSTIA